MKTTESKIDLSLILNSILYHWRLWFIPLFVVPCLTYLYVAFAPQSFRSTSKIMVQEKASVNPLLSGIAGVWNMNRRTPLIQSILKGSANIEQVLYSLGEIHEDDPHKFIADKIHDFGNRIHLIDLGGGLIQINFIGRSPEFARNALDLLVENFTKEMIRPQKESVEGANNYLQRELDRLRKELEAAEEEVARFKQKNAGELPEFQRVNLDAYLSYHKALMDAEIKLQSVQRKKRLMEDRLRHFNPVAQKLSKRLVEARIKLGEMKAAFTDAHPAVKAAQASVEELTQQLAQAELAGPSEPSPVLLGDTDEMNDALYGLSTPSGASNKAPRKPFTGEEMAYKSVSKEMESLAATVGLLRNHIKKSKKSVKAFAKNEKTLTRLIRDIEIKSKVYKSLLEKLEDSQVTKALALYRNGNQVWTLEPANLPTRPHGLNRKILLAGSGLAGLGFGLVLVFIFEFLTSGIRRKEEIEDQFGVEIIGTLPRLK